MFYSFGLVTQNGPDRMSDARYMVIYIVLNIDNAISEIHEDTDRWKKTNQKPSPQLKAKHQQCQSSNKTTN
jgi:hypothetical protein